MLRRRWNIQLAPQRDARFCFAGDSPQEISAGVSVARCDLSTDRLANIGLMPHSTLMLSFGERNEEKRMNEERISAARADMERRVAEFREKQAKFQREREDYYETTIEKVRATDWNEFVTPRHERRARH